MLRQRLIHEGVVRVKSREHRTTALEQVREKSNRFLIHGAAQTSKAWEMALTLLIERVEVVNVQPLTGELRRQPAHPTVAQHPLRLSDEHLRIVKLSRRRDLAKFCIGH